MALSDNLVAFWKLDEASGSRSDSHSNGYTLTDNNTVTSATGLVYGTAASFTSANTEWLSRADNADLSGGNADFTVAAWVNLADTSGTNEILGKGDAGGFEYNLAFSAALSRWRWRVASATAEANATFVDDGGGSGGGNGPAASAWHLVIAWHDSVNDVIGIATSTNSLTAYTTAYTFGVWDSTGDFSIGRSGPYFPSYMNGIIGPVMMWRRVLTSQDRTDLYNGGAGVTYAAMTAGGGGGSRRPSQRTRLGIG